MEAVGDHHHAVQEEERGSYASDGSDDEYARRLEADLLSPDGDGTAEETSEGFEGVSSPGQDQVEDILEHAGGAMQNEEAAGPQAGSWKRKRTFGGHEAEGPSKNLKSDGTRAGAVKSFGRQTDDNNRLGQFALLPAELLMHVLKFVSAEDLSTLALVSSTFRALTSDEGLWRSLYCNRWGPPPATDRRRSSRVRRKAWKQLYFERDSSEMRETLRTAPSEFREIYGQMAAAKRSEAPAVQQVHQVRSGDFVRVDTSVAEQISAWAARRTFEASAINHVCSGQTCSYHRIGDVFICERTGKIHVCDETCRETVSDPDSDLLVCGISGRCSDRWVTPAEEEEEAKSQRRAAEEQDTYVGGGRLAQAYYLGYNCSDEDELDAALKTVMYGC